MAMEEEEEIGTKEGEEIGMEAAETPTGTMEDKETGVKMAEVTTTTTTMLVEEVVGEMVEEDGTNKAEETEIGATPGATTVGRMATPVPDVLRGGRACVTSVMTLITLPQTVPVTLQMEGD